MINCFHFEINVQKKNPKGTNCDITDTIIYVPYLCYCVMLLEKMHQ